MENVGILGEKGIQLKVGVDGIAAAMVLLTGIMIHGRDLGLRGRSSTARRTSSSCCYMLAAGVFGTFVMLDLFFWFLLYETAVLPMYLLIAVWGSTRKEYGAMKLMMMLAGGVDPHLRRHLRHLLRGRSRHVRHRGALRGRLPAWVSRSSSSR